jgi:hypothetical protein
VQLFRCRLFAQQSFQSNLQPAEPTTNFIPVSGKLVQEPRAKLAEVPAMPIQPELPTAVNAALHAHFRSVMRILSAMRTDLCPAGVPEIAGRAILRSLKTAELNQRINWLTI